MKHDQMPDGFLAAREGGTVRVHLPEVEVTQSHVLEPMLSRGMAQQLAEALWNADVESPVDRVVLVHDTRYSEQALEKFRERLWAVLVEGGVETQIELESEPLVSSAPAAEPAPAAPEPPGPAPAPAATSEPEPQAAKPRPDASVSGRKAFVAPVPTKKRLGSDRGTGRPE